MRLEFLAILLCGCAPLQEALREPEVVEGTARTVEKASEGNWIGAISAAVGTIAAVAGTVYYKRKKRASTQ